MSAVRYFDVPHIFRYGRIDEKSGETWQLFWRNATCFTVDIARKDIAGTRLEQEWSKHCVEPTYSVESKTFVPSWNDFCDFTISSILPTLQELAPVGERSWTTLEDYLTTPLYKLRLIKDTTSGEAIVKVVEGPVIKPAFDMEPQPFNSVEVPPDFPLVLASDLLVLDQEMDLRHKPHLVKLSSTGEVYSLIPMEGSVTHWETGVTNNPSLICISKTLQLFRITEPMKIQMPTAIVTTGRDNGEQQIAGLLCTQLPETAKELGQLDAPMLASPERIVQWRAHLTTLLKAMHSWGIIHGNVNPYTILVDHASTDIWLCPPESVSFYSLMDPAKIAGEEVDWHGVASTFDEWLPKQMAEARGEARPTI